MVFISTLLGLSAVAGLFGTRAPSEVPTLVVEPKKLESFRRPSKLNFPKSNPFTQDKYELGKTLFFDARLSGSGTVSCSTCHNPDLSWSDGLARAKGWKGNTLPRRSPTLWNAAWATRLFWDGRASSLEEQALGPISSPEEMNLPLAELAPRLQSIEGYAARFEKVFPGEGISAENVARAIATFERTIVSPEAPFDRWVEGDERAVSTSAKRGFVVFTDVAHCVRCHTGWNFSNHVMADIGLDTADEGLGALEKTADTRFAFKAPTLRNVTERKHLMHDGSFTDLRDVIANYDQGGKVKRRTAQLFLKPLGLTETQKQDLVAFLETLTGGNK